MHTLLTELPAALQLHPVSPPVVSPIEGGLAGMVLLAESHAAVHTSVADRSAFIDVFSCRASIDADAAQVVVARVLPGTVQARLVRRGPEEAA